MQPLRSLELQHNLAGGVGQYVCVGQLWARDVAAQLFQGLAVDAVSGLKTRSLPASNGTPTRIKW
jgi:hypothetical protein